MAGFFPHPGPLPKGEGAFSLLPEGEGLGMRGNGIYIMKEVPFLVPYSTFSCSFYKKMCC
jgi:hypothetical protein